MSTKEETLELFEIKATNLISFEKKRVELRGCPHNKLVVNEGSAMLTCGDCGEQLDPMWALTRMAKHEETLLSKLHRQYVRLCNIEKEMYKKSKVKCKHCGRFTPVNIDMPSGEWMGLRKVKD